MLLLLLSYHSLNLVEKIPLGLKASFPSENVSSIQVMEYKNTSGKTWNKLDVVEHCILEGNRYKFKFKLPTPDVYNFRVLATNSQDKSYRFLILENIKIVGKTMGTSYYLTS